MTRTIHALTALGLCLSLNTMASAQPTPSPTATGASTPNETVKAAKAVKAADTVKPPACTLGASAYAGTFKAVKVTLIPVDKEEGGDCNQAHLWVEALHVDAKAGPCSLTFGIYVGDAKKDDTAKRITTLKSGPFKGTVDPAGMCYAEFSAR